MVGLGEDFADRYPHQLSGGQARRVGVARALALRPDILIADEPTAGLDVSIQGEVLNLLSGLQQEMGLGIMIITHNLNIVRHVADQMAIMYLGRFIEQGDSQQIFSQPRHPYTAALLSANPSPDPDAQSNRIELLGDVPSLLQRPTGCEFHTRCPRAQRAVQNFLPRIHPVHSNTSRPGISLLLPHDLNVGASKARDSFQSFTSNAPSGQAAQKGPTNDPVGCPCTFDGEKTHDAAIDVFCLQGYGSAGCLVLNTH